MVFSSIPAYLDPANWQQQPNHHHLTGPTTAATTHHHPPPLPLPPPPPHHGSTAAGSIRPGSMADRARLANIPMPETALKCPRCESTNTKFCYFNNYSLSQPRHFCKTCRRYWTRGGALRNVPVGGGCRRNKRSGKGSRSKSPVSSTDRPTGSSSSSAVSCNSGAGDMLGLAGAQIPPLRFMAPLHQLSEFGNDHIGLNYGSFSAPIGGAGDLNFQLGNAMAGGGGGGSILSMSVLDQLRLQQGQQYPLLGGLDISNSASSGLYPFEGGADQPGSYGGSGGALLKAKMTSSLSTQMASVKMEDNNLARQFMGMQGNENQFWSTTGTSNWAEISSFSSSTATNPI